MTSYTQTSSPDMLLKMAQAATRNSALLAHLIEEQCQQKNMTWAQLAAELQISEMQLAKLALCRRPGNLNFKSDVAQTARYTKIDAQKLTSFLQPVSEQKVIKKPFWQTSLTWPNKTGDQSMIVKRAIAFGVILIAIFFISAFIFSQPVSVEATLQVTNGDVSVQQAALFGQTKTVIVSGGETLTVSGSDIIEVPADADAILYLFEGSTVELAANTTLELTELADNGSEHQIYMTLFNGRILNRVTKLLGVNDAYEVRTPSSTASVRGTIFSVEVLDSSSSQIIVTEGIVAVSLGSEMAEVQAGEMVTAVSGQPLNVEPINNPELLAPAAPPAPAPTGNTSGSSAEEPGVIPDETTATSMPSDTTNAPTTTSESPAGTTASPVLPTARGTQPPASSATAVPPANSTSAPALPTNTARATQPPGSSATSLPPANTPVPSAAPTNTPVSVIPTNTSVPVVPTNTPIPVVPTNTPIPPPTNTPVPPTNTPVPPTEEPSQVTLCHNPGPNQQTIQVNADAVQGHLNHGDYLGACN